MSRKVHDFFERLRAEPDVEKRRKMVEDGKARWLASSCAWSSRPEPEQRGRAHDRGAVCKSMVGGAIGELFRLCNWELDTSDLAKAGNRDEPPCAS